MKKIGIIVMVVGLLMTVFTGFTVITKKEVLDVGPVEINQKEKTLYLKEDIVSWVEFKVAGGRRGEVTNIVR